MHLFKKTCAIFTVLLCLVASLCPVGFCADKSVCNTATLQNRMKEDAVSEELHQYVRSAVEKETQSWRENGHVIEVVNFIIDPGRSGQMHQVLKCISEATVIISYQITDEGSFSVLSLRLGFADEKSRTEQMMALISAQSAHMVDKNELRLFKEHEIEMEKASSYNTERVPFFLSLYMPYTTKNIKKLFNVLAQNGLSVNSFLFPNYQYDDEATLFLFEVSIAKRNFDRHYKKDSKQIEAQLLRGLMPRIPFVNKDTVDFQEEGSIAAFILQELLDSLAVNFGESAVDLTPFLAVMRGKFTRLRKDLKTPYILHITKAVKILVNECGVSDLSTVIALILHDSVEDGLLTMDELRKLVSPEIADIVALITRVHKKYFPKEISYLQAMLYAEGDRAARACLGKICDRIQNLRSLETGDPKFHRKIFFETLNTFVPEFLLHPQMDVVASGKYAQNFTYARDTAASEIILRGMYFGFIDSAGNINQDELLAYLSENNKYLHVPERPSAELVSKINQCYRIEYYQEIVGRLFNYRAAAHAAISFFYYLNVVDAPHVELYDFLLQNLQFADFFPERIKSSIVVFFHHLFANQKLESGLNETLLKQQLDAIIGNEEVNYLLWEIAHNIVQYMSMSDEQNAEVLSLFAAVYADYSSILQAQAERVRDVPLPLDDNMLYYESA